MMKRLPIPLLIAAVGLFVLPLGSQAGLPAKGRSR